MNRKKKTMDGNQAAAHVAYAYTEVAAIYPITPSSSMAEYMDEWSSKDKKNIFGQPVTVTQMQSEAGAAGAVHGSLIAGALSTTFTASQGLLLMMPNIYRIAGELLPGVFHVAARTISTHALSIFGDHSDIYACRQTGAAMLSTNSVQEIMDLAPVAHLSAIEGRIPFIHFFDGFRTSHEMQKIHIWDYETLKGFLNKEAIHKFRQNSLHPDHVKIMGSAQNPDIFFQNREACNPFYEHLPMIVEKYMHQINQEIGTDYQLFNYCGASDATHIIVAMGSVCETAEQTIHVLNKNGGKYGLIKVRLYRPFSVFHFLKALPKSVKYITVLNRTKEPGSVGEPLYLDVVAALQHNDWKHVTVLSGRYGLSSKDTTPEQILSVLKNRQKQHFTIGIVDDVTHHSLPSAKWIDPLPRDIYNCKFWGLGGDGTISANKSSVKIIGDHGNMQVQAYFDYDSKKSRGLTISHLRFGTSPIHAPYLIQKADFVACHNPIYMHKFNMVQDLKEGGTFLLNCYWKEQELEQYLPGQVKRYLASHHINFYIIDAISIGKEIGLNNKISTILQAAFFKVTNIMPLEKAIQLMKQAAQLSYSKQGEKIIEMNFAAIDRGISDVRKVSYPNSWLQAKDEPLDTKVLPDFPIIMDYVENLQKPITRQEGNKLPVSAFSKYVDGAFPPGTTAHERRNVATEVPVWIPENCIQCNLCSFVCPHAVIRPAVMTEEEKNSAPKGMSSLPIMGIKEKASDTPAYHFSVTISETDCTGCGSCAGVCPGKQGNKALEMIPVHQKEERQQYFDYGKTLPSKIEILENFKPSTIKGSQFRKPLLEFHGACAGCGETAYPKLVTQLFGEQMYIANATGCSSIWANSSPSAAYTVTPEGKGPAWSNSLFEDGAEFGYGMLLAQQAIRNHLKTTIETLCTNFTPENFHLLSACQDWLTTFHLREENLPATNQLISAFQTALLETEKLSPDIHTELKKLLLYKEYFSKKSQWIFGGDGFAYDIGFGGLDHVLASGKDINVLILDTEVYSNTGGQASKATPTGSLAKFTSQGKEKRKKDLASMLMTYGNIYIAQIAMGADYNQTLKALIEAERYPGPSLIIAYSPCISHGIKAGMGCSQQEEAKAVKTGYWHLFRYNPELLKEGKNPFTLDSKPPVLDYQEFLKGENRYTALEHMNPNHAFALFSKAKEDAEKKYQQLCKLAAFYEPSNLTNN